MRTQHKSNLRCSTWPRMALWKLFNMWTSSDDIPYDRINQNHDSSSGWLRRSSEPDPNPPSAQNLRMFVGTWNVGGRAPPRDEDEGLLNLKEWLQTSSHQLPHIYVIGFQEIVPLNAGNVLLGAEDKGPAATWLSLIGQALNSQTVSEDCTDEFLPIKSASDDCNGGGRYHLVASKQMVGIFLCVWARAELVRHVRNVRVSCVGTGIMGLMGNKGSVAVSMIIRGSSFCFVCTHLTSGEKKGDEVRRNLDIMGILKRTRFSHSHQSGVPLASILQHDKIIWLGDLNYRLIASCSNDTYELLAINDWQTLLERDQLRREQRAGRVFSGWEEGSIVFPPTYKYLANSHSFAFAASKSGDKPRTPAWCDRILWRGEGVKQMLYARGESWFSDHRPVHSLFSIDVEDYNSLHTKPISPITNSSSCSRVQAEELFFITRTQSCLATTRFY